MEGEEPTFLGIEIGGTKLQLALGPGDGRIVALRRLTVEPVHGASGIRAQIVSALPALLDDARIDRSAIVAAGVGFGGPVDALEGRIERSFQIQGWEGFPLSDWIRRELGVRATSVHNDADAAGLAESRFGAGRGLDPLLYITVGSGIGGALILNDRIYRGAGRGAVEIGHILVPTGDPGKWDELERIASGWGIARAGQALFDAGRFLPEGHDGTRPISGLDVAQASQKGVAEALAVLVRAQEALGFAIAQAVALVAPRRIVIGGGVSMIGASWFRGVREAVDRLALSPFLGSFEIVPAALGEEVVIQGALALARDSVLP